MWIAFKPVWTSNWTYIFSFSCWLMVNYSSLSCNNEWVIGFISRRKERCLQICALWYIPSECWSLSWKFRRHVTGVCIDNIVFILIPCINITSGVGITTFLLLNRSFTQSSELNIWHEIISFFVSFALKQQQINGLFRQQREISLLAVQLMALWLMVPGSLSLGEWWNMANIQMSCMNYK